MRARAIILFTLSLILIVSVVDVFAQRRARGGFRGSHRHGSIARVGFVGFRHVYPFYHHGFGFHGSYFGYPGYYYSRGDIASIDFNVEPQDAIIYIDDAYLGKVDDYNGWPGTAHVTPGKHTIRIETRDGQEYSKEVYAQPGKEIDFNYRFEGY